MSDIIVEETGLPLRFPDPRAEAYARAEEFRRLTPDRRLASLRDVLQLGTWFLLRSPQRQILDDLYLRREKEWQRIQRELFSHGE